MSSATADVSDVNSDQLKPEQRAELRAVIEKYTDQISWDPNDVGCLSDEFKEYFQTIPKLDDGKCKQRPNKLSCKSWKRLKFRCCVDKELSRRPTGLLISCRQCYSCQKPRKPEELRMCVDFGD